MADQYGFSLGQVMRDAEAIKGARQTNELNRMKLDAAKASQKTNALLRPLRQKAVGGDSEALQQVLALDPKGGAEFASAVQNAKRDELETLESQIDYMGNQAAGILQTLDKDPEQAMESYKNWYRSAPANIRKEMPTSNIKAWLQDAIGKATAMDRYVSEIKVSKFGGEDVMTKGGQIIERTKRPKTKAEIDAMGVPDKEIRTMANIISSTYGGEWVTGPDGESRFVGLSDEQNKKAMAALVRAVDLRNEIGPGSQAKAAQQAMQELGESFPRPDTRRVQRPTSRFALDESTGQVRALK